MDTKDTRVQNLLFLLSAAPIALGCVITGDDTDTDAATTSPTTNPTTGETDPTTSPTTEPMTTAQTTGDTTEGPSDTTETPSDTTEGPAETTTGGVELPEVCVTYGDQNTECYMDKDIGAGAAEYCAEILQAYYDAYGADCVTAFEEYTACLSALTCEEFTGADPVCEAEGMALDTACVAK